MLGIIAECLPFLRTVDAAEANTLRVGVVQEFDVGRLGRTFREPLALVLSMEPRHGQSSRDR
jgi:hypothetical protein